MIIKPKTRGFICTTAHPVGCKKNIEEQVAFAKAHAIANGPKRVLVVGASTGYGMASRIAAAFSCGAQTVGVFFERPSSEKRTATAGYYNNLAFEEIAKQNGLTAISLNLDAFSDEGKAATIAAIKDNMDGGQVDLVVYSLAAPKRVDPRSGQTYSSVIKPIGEVFKGKTVDFHTGEVSEVAIEPAGEEEIAQTIKVMGGEDWLWWMQAMQDAGVLAPHCITVAYSYIGPKVTHAVYRDGTIGKAKDDLEEKARQIDALLAPIGGKAYISVNKALVTQASAAIPVVPLYMSILFKQMKQAGTHEGCIEQMVRLFVDKLYKNGMPTSFENIPTDEGGRVRMDDLEMNEHLQQSIAQMWDEVNSENVEELTDLKGYRDDFYKLFGFGLEGIDYDADVQDF